jgi:hypothetical protein
MAVPERAISHEASHVIVGLHFGFNVDRVEVTRGRLNTRSDLDSPNRTSEERFIFLAAGIAGEKVWSPNTGYDVDASETDQSMITERGGRSIEEYRLSALDRLRLYQSTFRRFRAKLTTQWIAEEAEASLTSDFGCSRRRSFVLLSLQEVDNIWALR